MPRPTQAHPTRPGNGGLGPTQVLDASPSVALPPRETEAARRTAEWMDALLDAMGLALLVLAGAGVFVIAGALS